MKKLFYILLFITPFIGFSQRDTVAHLYAFGGVNNDNAEAIEATSDGGYIVVGSTSSNSSGNTDIYLLKVDSLCGYEWSFALGGTNNDLGYAVKQTFDKGFIITASSNSTPNGGYNAVLYKRDSLGGYVWTKYYGGQDWDFAYDVVQTYDSGFVFCGETYNNTNGFSDVYVVKTNNLGDTLWTRTLGGALIDKGNAIIETSDSNIVIAGTRNTVVDSAQAYLIKLNSTGTVLWDSIYGTVDYEEINGMIEVNDNGFVLTGATTSFAPGDDLDYYLLKTDKDGVKIWDRIFAAPGHEVGYDLLELANGSIFNVGYTEANGNGGKDAKILLITAGGFWGGQNSSFGGVLDDETVSVAMGKDGSMVLAGYTNSYGSGLNDLMLIDVDTITINQQFTVDTIYDLAPLVVVDYTKKQEVSFYPNPVSKTLNITSSITLQKVELYDLYGRKTRVFEVEESLQLDMSNLKNGLYTVLFYSKGLIVSSQKIIIFNK